jgi:predicted alpha/beta hydrolase family esterase
MKRAVIVHCWGGKPDYCWYPWAKQQLEAGGFTVALPAMSETDTPKLSAWLPELVKTIGQPDEELFLIGHSLGCVTIMRYLESLPAGVKVGGIVFVAGFTDNLGYPELENFFRTPLDLGAVKSHLEPGAVFIHSDNDKYVDVKYGEELAEKLAGKLMVFPGMGHFSGPLDSKDSCTELPAVMEAIKELEAKRG